MLAGVRSFASDDLFRERIDCYINSNIQAVTQHIMLNNSDSVLFGTYGFECVCFAQVKGIWKHLMLMEPGFSLFREYNSAAFLPLLLLGVGC